MSRKGRKVVPDDGLDDLHVHVEVLVDDTISDTGYLPPRYFGASLPKLGRDPRGGFSEDLEKPREGESRLVVGGGGRRFPCLRKARRRGVKRRACVGYGLRPPAYDS